MTTHPCYLLQYARHALLRIGKMAEGGGDVDRAMPCGWGRSRAGQLSVQMLFVFLPCLWRMASLGCTWRMASLVWLFLPFGLAWATAAESGRHQTCK